MTYSRFSRRWSIARMSREAWTMSTLRAVRVVVFATLPLLFLADTPVLANGSKAKRVRYNAEVQIGDTPAAPCRFDAEVEPLLFRLTTVRDKYRVVRIAVRNDGNTKLVLSRTADRMEIQFLERPAPRDPRPGRPRSRPLGQPPGRPARGHRLSAAGRGPRGGERVRVHRGRGGRGGATRVSLHDREPAGRTGDHAGHDAGQEALTGQGSKTQCERLGSSRWR